jgi:hypothetical protein
MKNFNQVSKLTFAQIGKELGANEYSGLLYLNDEMVGYCKEWDREEDRIYYDYFVREDVYNLYEKSCV